MRNLESQIKVGVNVDQRQRQRILVGRFLHRGHRLPVERSERKVLLQLSGKHRDGVARLSHFHGVGQAPGVRRGVGRGEIRVVFHLVKRHAERGAGLLVSQHTLHTEMIHHRQVVVVPPEMASLIVAIVERRLLMVVETRRGKRHGILPQREIDIDATIHMNLTGVDTRHAQLARDVVMQRPALRLDELCAHAQGVLVPRAHRHGVGQGEVAQLMGSEELQSGLRPFVESLQHRDGKRVAKTPMGGLVVDGIARQLLCDVIAMEIIIGRRLIRLIDATIVVEVERVDETGDRHILILEPRGIHLGLLGLRQQAVGSRLAIDRQSVGRLQATRHTVIGQTVALCPHADLGVVGASSKRCGRLHVVLIHIFAFLTRLPDGLRLGATLLGLELRSHGKLARGNLFGRHGHLVLEAHAIALGEEDVLVVVAVPVAREHGGYLRGVKRLVERLGMGDVVIIGDTTILGYLLMVGRHQQVRLIAVAQVRAIHGIVEMGGRLAVVIATTIEIIELKAHAQALARIHTKLRGEMVLTIGAVATVVVSEVGEGREGVGEMEIAHWRDEIIVGVGKQEL